MTTAPKPQAVKVGDHFRAKMKGKNAPVVIIGTHPDGGWKATNLITNRPVHIKSADQLLEQLKRDDAESKKDSPKSKDAKSAKTSGTKTDSGKKSTAKPAEKSKSSSKPKGSSGNKAKPEKPKAATSKSRGRGRVSITLGAQAKAVEKEIADLDLSKDHIAFTKNGKIFEIYFREHNGSPTVMKAPADGPLDPDGYRSDGVMIVVTGTTHVTEAIKKATGKTPGRIGISLKKWQRSSAGTGAKPKKKSSGGGCLDAAEQVLKDASESMSCKDMIDTMLAKKLWSTNGKTPSATLYSAILREITTKGDESRFKKVDRGQFALTDASDPQSGGRGKGK